MAEPVYYEDKRFVVTRSSFKTPEGNFPISEIGSARRGKRKPSRIVEFALLLLCPIFAAAARTGSSTFWLVAAVCGAAAIGLLLLRRDVYLILLYMGSGERSITVGNRDLSIRVCNAVNVAVMEGHPRQVTAVQSRFDVTLPDLASELSQRPASQPAPQPSPQPAA